MIRTEYTIVVDIETSLFLAEQSHMMDASIASRREPAASGSAGPHVQGRQVGTMMTTDQSGLVIGVVFTCLVFISVTIAVRLMVRKMMPHHRFYLDDLLVLIASILTLALCMLSLEGTKHGLGQHFWKLFDTDSEVEDTIMLMWIGQILYYFAISFAKFSIISSYFRIFPYKRLHQMCWAVLATTVAFLFGCVLATIFICRPIQAAWDPTLRTPTSCIQFVNVLYASAIYNVVTDVILCVLPLPYFLKLRIPWKQKASASCLFIAGGLAAIASGMRGSCAYELAGDGTDITYNIAETLIWSVLECTISIMTISIPAMRPLFAKFAPSIFNVANVTEDHKKLVDRISRHLGRSGSLMQRLHSRSSWSSRSSLQRADSNRKRTSAGTDITDSTEGGWVPKERTIVEENAVEDKV